MAYTSANLNLMVAQGPIDSGPRLWVYKTTDAAATVKGAGYITDATNKGMVKGDIVLGVNVANPYAEWLQVSSISSGAATLVDFSNLA